MRAKVFQHHSVSITQFAFQACSFNHSDISPFRFNKLQQLLELGYGDCDKSSDVLRSLTGSSSIPGWSPTPGFLRDVT